MVLKRGHLQSIWSAKCALDAPNLRYFKPAYQRRRYQTPDGDFIDIDYQCTTANQKRSKPLWVLFHGLEGSSLSHYARAFAQHCHQNHIDYCVPHFRGCSGQINLAPRAYHCGDWQEIDWILKQIQAEHETQELHVVGVSLGGNALMRWAGELGQEAKSRVKALVSICAPLDLLSSGRALGEGLNRYIYTPMFLRSMKRNALLKLMQYPQLFEKEAMLKSKTLYEFDNAFTAPLHGFKSTNDYWVRASALPHMHKISVPALAINSTNDPFIPANSLPSKQQISQHVQLWQPTFGGHVGFVSDFWRGFPGHLQLLPRVVEAFFETGEVPEEVPDYG